MSVYVRVQVTATFIVGITQDVLDEEVAFNYAQDHYLDHYVEDPPRMQFSIDEVENLDEDDD